MSLLYMVIQLTTELSWRMQGSSGSELSAALLPQELLCRDAGCGEGRKRSGSLLPLILRQVSRDSEVSEESEVTLIHTGRLSFWGVHSYSFFPLPPHRVSMGCAWRSPTERYWGCGCLLPGHGHEQQQGSGASLGL